MNNDTTRAVVFRMMLITAFTFFLNTGSISQSYYRGTITGIDGQPLPGATIIVKGTVNATTTNGSGQFTIAANPGSVLEISFIGYRNQSFVLGSATDLNIILTDHVLNLDEAIVIGYGTSRRKDLTGAVTRIYPADFNKGVITNSMQQLQGRVAGLVIVQPGGDPNGDLIVRIRGASSLEGQPPLLVIDGIAIDDFQKTAATLNPADIESYDILKDASASAIYGSRGANGVILVTTKRGKAGRTQIEYNGFVGLEKVSNQFDVLTADQWRKATATNPNASGLDKGGNVDWQKTITRNAFSQSHTVGISGGTKLFSYYGSIGYLKQEGTVIGTGKDIITARLTAIQKSLNEKLEIRYGINTAITNRDFLHDQNSTSQSRNSGSNIFDYVIGYLPVWPVYNQDGSYFLLNQDRVYPFFPIKEIYSEQKENYFQGSVKADLEVVNGLKLGMLGSLSRGSDTYDKFVPSPPGTTVAAEASKFSTNKQIFTGDIHGNYRKDFGRHTIDLTGVYEYNYFLNDGFGVNARGFLVPDLLNNNLGLATNVRTGDISSFKNEVKLISYLGRAVYSFDNRYILTANFRRDGSSKFGPNRRWGNFPSIAFAWRAGNEKWLKDVKWLNDLKFRVSFGYTGNQENLPPNAYQPLYGPSGPYLYNNQFLQSYAIIQENNPDLKWEVRQSLTIGVDFSLFDNRLSGSLDVFDDRTNDMLFLYDIPVPPFITDKVIANAASALNRGVELTLAAAIVKNKKFNWNTSFNIGTIKNEITNLSGSFKGTDLTITSRHYGYAEGMGLSGAYITELKVGYPAGVFWIPEFAGLDASGKELFNNYDADGKFTGISDTYADKDRRYIDPTPRVAWGLNNQLQYGSIDLGFFLRGVHGQKIFSNTLLVHEGAVYLPAFNVTEKALTNRFSNQPKPSTYWLRNGSFVRMENITLAYNFNGIKGINLLKIYLTATNLFVITPYEGIDPEIRTEGTQRYIDKNYYPKTRGFVFGINLSF